MTASDSKQGNEARPAEGLLEWGDAVWKILLDPSSGALMHIENRGDPHRMNWLREAGRWVRRDWKPAPGTIALDGQWGLVETAHTGLMHVAQVRRVSDRAWEAVYTSAALTVTIRRELDASGDLVESYEFKNTGVVELDLPIGSVSVTAPFFDQYPDTQESLERRCHAHIWTGGASSWVNAQRMGTAPPHLGLVVTEGSLAAYSQRGGTFNDRGVFLLHPGAMRLKHLESATFAWRLFWHQGWEDFFTKPSNTPGFVRLAAKDYVVTAGQSLEISAEYSASLAEAKILANGKDVPTHIENGRLAASIPTTAPGDLLVSLELNGRLSNLRAHVTPPVDDLIEERLKFIVRKQQRIAPGDPLDGAYLCYDNETGEQVFDAKWPDHNAGRERVGMGVLGALYLPHCRDITFKAELAESLRSYAGFIARELEGDDGVIYEAPGRTIDHRLYNFPWVARFHLAMYRATGDAEQLDRYVRVMRAYYARDGMKFYAIGIPICDGLDALAKAGRAAEREELLALFRKHADQILANGTNYPRSEVNFEQSIVAPAVQLLAEMALVTGDLRHLDGARAQMPVLEAFAGKQPDARLNEVAIRHWDDFWFGKLRVYGDTMPHYWSTINALAYAYYGLATKDDRWLRRADAVIKANLTLFTPQGTGTAAYLYAFATNGIRGQRNDPWANDQDWALANLLIVRSLSANQPHSSLLLS